MKTVDRIIDVIRKNAAVSVDSLAIELKVSRQYIHRVLKDLIESGILVKMGQAPHVYYTLTAPMTLEESELIGYLDEQFLQQHFLVVDALGNKLEGLSGMKYWCKNQQLPLTKTVKEFIQTRQKYLAFYNQEHLIDGISKLKNTKGIDEIGVDELYYLDFYAIERFGKTRLGCLMHYAKQGQNKNLMKMIVDEIRNRLQNMLVLHHVDAVLFVPPTISRKVQIMDFLEKELKLNLPKITVKKVSNEIVIPQKALSKIFERVANAKHTFVVPKQKMFNRVLIIDDAIGSGATINEIALKAKSQKLAKHITGLAITGSYKGFEVISEL